MEMAAASPPPASRHPRTALTLRECAKILEVVGWHGAWTSGPSPALPSRGQEGKAMQRHLMIPLPARDPALRHFRQEIRDLVRTFLREQYDEVEHESRALDSLFIHAASELLWDTRPGRGAPSGAAPTWQDLDVDRYVELVQHTFEDDDSWLLHAMASVSSFVGWLVDEGRIDDADATIRALDDVRLLN